MSPADQSARLSALLLAIDPLGLKGAIVHGQSPMACEQWLEFYSAIMPATAAIKRVPSNISEERLLGGLDFAATLSRGRAVCERGLLACANDGSIVLQAATSRGSKFTHIARAIDRGEVSVERDGFSEAHATNFCTIVFQCDDDESAPAAIWDRTAFAVDLHDTTRSAFTNTPSRDIVMAARARLGAVRTDANCIEAIARGAARLGIVSVRTIQLALAAARAHASLLSHDVVTDEDIAASARLVLAPRATVRPELDDAGQQAENQDDPNASDVSPADMRDNAGEADDNSREPDQRDAAAEQSNTDNATASAALTEIVVRAATAALPPGLLAAAAAKSSASNTNAGRAGNESKGGVRGRQIGVRRGEPRGGARLDLVATLRAAVPLQRVRRNARTDGVTRVVELRRDDFRVRRCATPTTTTTLFVVDASGSAALHRLAEAKGAVEMMLAEGYARRDKVALIAFRGTVAELVLPPTHALARARRAVSGMPAGGGTPLATALDVAAAVVLQLRRDTSQVVAVILTDGRANVARDGKGGRARAEADANDAATRLRAAGADVVWIDTSSRSEILSRTFAEKAGARYLLLPAPSARGLTDVAKSVRNEVSLQPHSATPVQRSIKSA